MASVQTCQAFLTFRRGVVQLQALQRGARARKILLEWRRQKAATAIAAAMRTCLASLRFRSAKMIALKVQSWNRCKRSKARYLADRELLMKLQRWWRSVKKRRRFRNLQQSVLKIQALWRGHSAKRKVMLQRAAWHRLKLAVTHLVRIRRKKSAERAWRTSMMQLYNHASPKGRAAPSKAAPWPKGQIPCSFCVDTLFEQRTW